MKIEIRGDKIKVTDAIKLYVEEKIKKLEKYFENKSEVKAYAVIKVLNNEQIIEITIPTNKFTLRSESKHNDLYVAVDATVDKLERQIRKNKSKVKKHIKEIIEENIIELEDIEERKIVRRKKVELRPMSEEEAMLQLDLLDHDFYFFKNDDTNKVSVIYKRKNNTYGIIEGE